MPDSARDGVTHITTSGGLITDTFIAHIRELDVRQPGTATASFVLPWADPPKGPGALENAVAVAWAEGDTPAPFVWDTGRRARLRAELDAVYAHLYGLTREELAYVLDTFPIVHRKDEDAYGAYRTKRMVLAAFETTEPLINTDSLKL
jgi:hypothetical protein